MTLKRGQGRPTRGIDDVGRDKLLEAARLVLRSKLSATFSRQDIARAAGVTPALVSYYFADKPSLVMAAVQPIIENYARAVLRILEFDASHGERFEKLVLLLLRFSAEEGGVLDAYFSHANGLTGSPVVRLLPDVWDRLTAFFEAGVAARAWRSVEPALLLISLWGLCKAVAESAPTPVRVFDLDPNADTSRRHQADFIVSLVRDGISAGVQSGTGSQLS